MSDRSNDETAPGGDEDIHNRVLRVVLRYGDAEQLFTGEIAAVDRLPQDATLVRTFEDPGRRELNFVFRHESFGAVEQGEVIPKILPEYRPVDSLNGTQTGGESA